MDKSLIGMIFVIIMYTIPALFLENILIQGIIDGLMIAVDIFILFLIYRCKDKLRDKKYWLFSFIAFISLTMGNTICWIRDFILGIEQDSFISDIGYAGFPIFLTLSLFHSWIKENRIKEIVKKFLNSISLISMFIYFIILIFFSNQESFSGIMAGDWIIKTFLTLDCILLGVLFLTFFANKKNIVKRKYVILKALGVLLYSVADVIYIYSDTVDTFGKTNFIGIFWSLGVTLVMLSIWQEAHTEEEVSSEESGNILDRTKVAYNIIGILALGVIINLDTSIANKSLIVLFLTLGYTHIVQMEVHMQVEKINGLNRDLIDVNKKLENTARIDHLTGLGNRRAFDLEIDRIIKEVENHEIEGFALFLIDLNGFKEINDSYGHDVGDAVIVEVSKNIRDSLSPDCFVSRHGGDEFVILVPYRYRVEIDSAIESIEVGMRDELDIPGYRLSVGFSLGVSIYLRDGKDKDTLIKKADTAMYAVKRQRKAI